MMFRHGAIHDPDHPDAIKATPFRRVGALSRPVRSWFDEWDWHPDDGDILGNDQLSCCVPAADLRLIQAFKARDGVAWHPPLDLVEIRYAMVSGWQHTEETDLGTVTQADCFDWSIAPIVADGTYYSVKWTSVQPADVHNALLKGPLLATLSLEAAVQDDPLMWQTPVSDDPASLHRVVIGALMGSKLACVTYGMIVPVDASRLVAVDLMETTTA